MIDLTITSPAKNMNGNLTVGDAARPDAQSLVRLPTRIITYAWGAEYVDTLLTLTLPALLAPDNLPFVASEVPCTLVILTERSFFAKFDSHPVIAEIRKHCRVRLIGLDDLIVSKDKYGMSLTYVLHRGFQRSRPRDDKSMANLFERRFYFSRWQPKDLDRHAFTR